MRRLLLEDLKEAGKALKEALENAPWGQNGAVFVTIENLSPPGERFSGVVKTLYINSKKKATLSTGKHYRVKNWVEVFTLEEGEQDLKKLQKEEERRAYDEERQLLIDALRERRLEEPTSFGEWAYIDGQKGGYFSREKKPRISARGAIIGVWGKEFLRHKENYPNEKVFGWMAFYAFPRDSFVQVQARQN